MRSGLLLALVLSLGCGPDPAESTDESSGSGGTGSTQGSPGGSDGHATTGGDAEPPVPTSTGDDDLDMGEDEADTVSAETIVDQAPVRRPVPGSWPAGAFGGTQYLAVWEDHRARRPILYGGRVAADGTALDPYGFPILDAVGSSGNLTYEPSVAFDGTSFLVVTEVAGQLRGVRVSAAGEVLDPDGFVIADPAGTAGRPSLMFDGQRYLVAWSVWDEPASPDNGIYLARVEPDGTVLEPGGALAYPLADQLAPVSLSFDGEHTLLSWFNVDPQTNTLVIEFGRVAGDGTLVDGAPKQVVPVDVSINPRPGIVAGFDGTNHVIAWSGTGQVQHMMASRVTPEGVLLDPHGVMVAADDGEFTSVHRLAMAAGDGHNVLVWSSDGSDEGGPLFVKIRAVQIAADGAVSHPSIHEFTRGLEATLVAQPNGALLLWCDGAERYEDYPAIVGTRIDAAGAIIPGEVAPAMPASRQAVRAVASDGQTFFVVWTDTRERSGQGTALFGARLAADGTPLDGEPLQFTDHPTDLTDVVFDGANFVVSWVRFTSGEGDGNPFRSVRVSPAGERLDDEPLYPPLYSPRATLASASDGTHMLLVGEDYPNELAAVLMDQQGKVVSEVIPILDEDQDSSADPAVAFADAGYLVVWRDSTTVFGQRISQAGTLVGQRFSIIESDSMYHVDLTAGGGNHLLVWQDDDGISAARLSPDGQLLAPGEQIIAELEPASLPWCCDDDAAYHSSPSAAFDGEKFVVAWRALADAEDANTLALHAAVVSSDGEVVQQLLLAEAPGRYGPPFLAGGAGRVVAAYSGFVPEPPYATRRALARLITP